MPRCDYCHKMPAKGAHPFTLRLELFPAVEPSLNISPEDLERDLKGEMERLIKLLEQMDESQVVEQEKQMFVSYSFTLCGPCRHRIAQQLARLAPPAP